MTNPLDSLVLRHDRLYGQPVPPRPRTRPNRGWLPKAQVIEFLETERRTSWTLHAVHRAMGGPGDLNRALLRLLSSGVHYGLVPPRRLFHARLQTLQHIRELRAML